MGKQRAGFIVNILLKLLINDIAFHAVLHRESLASVETSGRPREFSVEMHDLTRLLGGSDDDCTRNSRILFAVAELGRATVLQMKEACLYRDR